MRACARSSRVDVGAALEQQRRELCCTVAVGTSPRSARARAACALEVARVDVGGRRPPRRAPHPSLAPPAAAAGRASSSTRAPAMSQRPPRARACAPAAAARVEVGAAATSGRRTGVLRLDRRDERRRARAVAAVERRAPAQQLAPAPARPERPRRRARHARARRTRELGRRRAHRLRRLEHAADERSPPPRPSAARWAASARSALTMVKVGVVAAPLFLTQVSVSCTPRFRN